MSGLDARFEVAVFLMQLIAARWETPKNLTLHLRNRRREGTPRILDVNLPNLRIIFNDLV